MAGVKAPGMPCAAHTASHHSTLLRMLRRSSCCMSAPVGWAKALRAVPTGKAVLAGWWARFALPTLRRPREHSVGRLVAVHPGADVDDHRVAHVDAGFERGGAHVRQEHD